MAADGGYSSQMYPCFFSPKSHKFLALCPQDGRLRIWNTDSKTLHQEYVPSSHLSATCTCISWGPCRTTKEGPLRKKRKSEANQSVETADLLALGTAAGSILIYSTVQGALHCTLDGGHSGAVNAVQWHPEQNVLYSGSDDSHIAEWDLETGKLRCKWKADRTAVTSLCVSPNGKLLLSAGMRIKLWDLETKEVYRKFTGHSTMVTTLCFATTRPPDSDGLYFLSGAAHDRLLSVWQVRSDKQDKNAVVSFMLTDEPQYIDLLKSDSKEEAVKLAVVCKDGQLHLFEHFLNGPCKKPLSPACSLQVSTPGGTADGDTPMPVPLLAVGLDVDKQGLLLAYGNLLQPVIEAVPMNTTERHVCLVRDLQATLSLSISTAVSLVKTPIVNEKKSKILVPGLPGHQVMPKSANQSSQSQKRKSVTSATEMSIAERLEQVDLESKDGEKGTASLKTDSCAVLLAQGLESRDKNILNRILSNRKELVIRNTVSRIPLPAILPLLEEISARLQGHPNKAHAAVFWLRAVLTQHTSYLASLPDLASHLGRLYHLIESRVRGYELLMRLHGKLYLIMTQVATSQGAQKINEVDHTAKLVYEEESSDEEVASEDEGLPDDEAENWEEEEDDEEEDMDTTDEKLIHSDEKMEEDSNLAEEPEPAPVRIRKTRSAK